jgi:hypothetical protein
MRKMILLAAMSAIAALMLAATPAFAQPITEIDGFRFSPGNCGGNLEGTTLTREEAAELLEEEGLDPEELPDAGNVCLLDEPNGNGNGDDDDDDDRDDRDFRNFCRFFDCRDNDDNNVVPAFEITQDFEQEAESGDVDQSFDVSQTGDNSNQTVGIQGVANTGNAQNQIGVVDAGGFGDFDGNNDDERFFFVADDFCDFGDFDGDGICDRLDRLEDRFEDRCENGDHDGDGFCDRLEDRIEDLEDRVDDGFFFVADDFDNDDDRFFVNNGSDFEFEDVGASIELSPTNTTSSDQQVNQAAAAFGK